MIVKELKEFLDKMDNNDNVKVVIYCNCGCSMYNETKLIDIQPIQNELVIAVR